MPRKTRAQAEEEEANLFAMYLLMPENMVRAEVNRQNLVIAPRQFDMTRDEDLQAIADVFQVPLAIAAVRLSEIYNTLK